MGGRSHNCNDTFYSIANLVKSRLTNFSPLSQVYVINDEATKNAFVLPGGKVSVLSSL